MLVTTQTGDHDIDPDDVDCTDEISGDEQLQFVWCDTCQRYEWHWLPRRNL